MKYRVLRDIKLKLLFETMFNNDTNEKIIDNFFDVLIENPIEENKENLYLENIDLKHFDMSEKTETEIKDIKYMLLIFLDDITSKIEILDSYIVKCLKSWSIDRLNKVDLAILRLSVYELFFTDIDYQIVINEAVILSKTYSLQQEKSYRFINKVLAEVINLSEYKNK